MLLVVIDSSENLENPENSEQPDSWPPELKQAPVAMTVRSPLPSACGGCGFGEGTFAGVSGNDEDAPIPVIPATAINPPSSTKRGKTPITNPCNVLGQPSRREFSGWRDNIVFRIF